MKRLSAGVLALCLLSACGAQPEAPEPIEFPEAPPELTVTAGEASCTALQGGWSWNCQLEDGSYSGVIADSSHPLEFWDEAPLLAETEGAVVLSFPIEPDSVTVWCWPEAVREEAEPQAEAGRMTGDVLTLQEGSWLYQVQAEWNREPDYWGDAWYAFRGEAE